MGVVVIEAVWTAVEVAAFVLLVSGADVLWGVGWALVGAGLLLSAVSVWRAARMGDGGAK